MAFDRYDVSETGLAPEVLQQLRPGMLCLADRAFVGFDLWRTATVSGADLLWRVRKNQVLPCQPAAAGRLVFELPVCLGQAPPP
jgi:hypothetical protein